MKFQPGQSGNPAGRPLGSRNKATIAKEEELAKRAEKAVEKIVIHAGMGNATAMRICAEWVKPGGNSRALALELPRITCAADAQAALDTVIEAFGGGELTVREFPTMLGSVDRMARVAQRIVTMREEEQERYGKRRVHGVHPDMIPKAPPGWTDPYEVLSAALDRGENPWPDDPEKYAYVMGGEVLGGEPLHSPVNSDQTSPSPSESDATSTRGVDAVSETPAPSLHRAAGEGGSPERSAGEPGGGLSQPDLELTDRAERDDLYSPVNLDDEPPVARSGEGDALYFSVNSEHELAGASPPPGAADAALPSPASGGGMNALYSPVNSDASGEESPYLTPG